MSETTKAQQAVVDARDALVEVLRSRVGWKVGVCPADGEVTNAWATYEARVIDANCPVASTPTLDEATVARELSEPDVERAWDLAYQEVPPVNGRKVYWSEHRPIDIAWHMAFARRIAALASRCGEREVREIQREAADKAMEAVFASLGGIRRLPVPASWPGTDAIRDELFPPLPASPVRSVTLSDGRVFEREFWDFHGAERNVWTYDIVTNKGVPGRESRLCFESVEQMRERYHASWADWQLIDRAVEARAGEGK